MIKKLMAFLILREMVKKGRASTYRYQEGDINHPEDDCELQAAQHGANAARMVSSMFETLK